MVKQGDLESGRHSFWTSSIPDHSDDMFAACDFFILTKCCILALAIEIGTIPGFINNVPAGAWCKPSLTRLGHGIQ